ncbi:hypothetical protein AB0I06_05715 [Streptomyces sp. NPDC050674]|uniref:hypothetical protein n=1 Tax=Streptomyces sp. NPDC050674 TaxID=3157216 RepID=UPI0034486ED9
MKAMRRVLASAVLALSIGGLVAPAVSAAPAQVSGQVAVSAADDLAAARNCRAGDNHDEVAAKFISRCKKGSIRREFPTDRLSRTLGEIFAGKQSGDRDDVKAWKLLNDRRFDK